MLQQSISCYEFMVLGSIIFIIYTFHVFKVQNTCVEDNLLIQSGKISHYKGITVFNEPYSQNINTKSIKISFKFPNEGTHFALSSGSIHTKKINISEEYQWLIKGKQNKQKNEIMIILRLAGKNLWQNFYVNYFVTSRKDIITGEFIIDSISNKNCIVNPKQKCNFSMTNFQKYQHNLQKWISIKYIPQHISLFLSGLKTTNSNIETLKFTQIYLNTISGLLQFSIEIDQNSHFDFLQLSYIIVLNPQFTVNEINFSQDFSFTANIGFSLGRTNLQRIIIHHKPNSMKCFGNFCFNKCINKDICQIFHGQLSENNCYICVPESFYSFKTKACAEKCKIQGQFYHQNSCKCPQNMIIVNNKCAYCPQKSVSNQILNICQCPTNYQWNISTKVCNLNQCPQNSILTKNNTKCLCNKNYFQKNDKCFKCPVDSSYNKFKKQCICDDILKVNKNDKCVYCTKNSKKVGNKCQCLQGYLQVDEICVK